MIDGYIAANGGSVWNACLGLYHKMAASDFIRKVAETFATRIILIGIGLATSVIVARILGPEGRGLYAVAAAIGAIGVQFGNLGLHASNTYYVAKDRSLLPALLGNTIVVSMALGGFGAILAWMIFSIWPHIAPVQGFLLLLGLIWIPFGLAYQLFQNLLLGIREVRAYNKIELLTKILGVGLLILIILGGAITVEIVFAAGLISLVIGSVWAFWRLTKYLSQAPKPSLALFKDNVHYGLKAYLAAFFAFLVLRMDLVMVNYLLGPEDAGYYSIAVAIADMMNLLPMVIGTILFPKLSSLTNVQEKWLLTRKVAFGTGGIMLFLGSLATFLASPAVQLLYGETFLPAVPAFLWLIPGILMLSVVVILSCYIASMGIPIIVVFMYFFMAVLNVIMNWYLIPILGIIGAAISSAISYSFIFGSILLIAFSFGMKNEPS